MLGLGPADWQAIEITFKRNTSLPKATSATPPLRLPMSVQAIGEVKAMRPSFTFASSTPTMVKVKSVPARRPTRCWKVTVAPNRTLRTGPTPGSTTRP